MSYLLKRLMNANSLAVHSVSDTMPDITTAEPAPAERTSPEPSPTDPTSPEPDRKPFWEHTPSPDRKPLRDPSPSPDLPARSNPPSPTSLPSPDVAFNARLRRSTSDALHQLWMVEMGSYAERQAAQRAARDAAVSVCDVIAERVGADAANILQCLLGRYGELAQAVADKPSPDMAEGPMWASPDESGVETPEDEEVEVLRCDDDFDEAAYKVEYDPDYGGVFDFNPERVFDRANPPKLDKGKGRAVPFEPVSSRPYRPADSQYVPTWEPTDHLSETLTRDEILALTDPSSEVSGAAWGRLAGSRVTPPSESAVSEAGSETAGVAYSEPAVSMTPNPDTRAFPPLSIPHHPASEPSTDATSPGDVRTPERPLFVRAAGVSPEVRRRPPPPPLHYRGGELFGIGEAEEGGTPPPGVPFTPATAEPVTAPPPLAKRKRRSEVERLELIDSMEGDSPAPRPPRDGSSLAAMSTKREEVDEDNEDEAGDDTPVAKRRRPSRASAPPPKSKPRSRSFK
ncbi:uncharacterized protein LOC62_05G007430 [Vanrija pseudolonga]|uniref:Uncharacterized protein n=1 Tax=Vanrija pseudolonga TaxID=143232 RepID=A0AAF0YDF6_9TREE|nr:hypothetical protein LOC62_05G007430 [Vanrija pseudolonga]